MIMIVRSGQNRGTGRWPDPVTDRRVRYEYASTRSTLNTVLTLQVYRLVQL